MTMSNRQILQKADTVVNDLLTGGGYMQPDQAKKFIKLLILNSVLMPEATVIGMKRPSQLIDKVRFSSRIMRPGTEGEALPIAQRSVPDFSQVTLETSLIKGEVRISSEALEDNIERAGFKNTLMAMIAERAALDLEDLAVNGNIGSADPYLALFNGVRALITTNTVTVAPKAAISKTHLKEMRKAMPPEFQRNPRLLRYLTSVDAMTDYRDSLADRPTPSGDAYRDKLPPVTYQDTPMLAVPVFPENLGGGTDETEIIYVDPKNIYIGFWRRIQIETDKDVSAGQLIIVITTRMGVELAHEPAAVKLDGIEVS